MRRSDVKYLIAMLAILALAPRDAWAILESCDVSATALPFGVYNPASSSPRDASGTITVTCEVTLFGLLASWSISLSPGSSASYAPRRLASGPATLNYNIYTNAARTTVWGNGSGTTVTVSDSVALSIGTTTRHYTMYGRIPSFQDSKAGSYSDSIVVTLMY
jgi:spore coat protein U-like protein